MTQKDNKRSYIKEAEQNALNEAKYYTDMLEFMYGMSYNMLNRIDSYAPGRADLADGFALIRKGLCAQQAEALSRCFAFVGVGGEEARKYSKETAKQVFDGRYSVSHLLDEHFRYPSCWRTEDEENLKAELKEALRYVEDKDEY